MKRTLRVFIAGVGLLVLAAGLRADIVLHPGTITGTAGLSNWTFDSGNIYAGGNPNGFSGSATVSGTPGATYALTVEGGQTYGSLSESFSQSSPYASFSMSRTTSLTVPVGGTVSGQDLLTPGGTVQLNVSATTAPGATAVISNIDGFAYGSNASGTESYSSFSYTYGVASLQMPMAATQAAISVYGSVSFSLTDQNGQSCYVYSSIPYPYPTVATLSEGELATVDQAFDLSSELCATGVGTIAGTVQFNAPPPSFVPSGGSVCVSGPVSQCASIAANPFGYSFGNLPAGYYSVEAYEQFGASSTTSLNLSPNGGLDSATIQGGDTFTRNFIYDAAAAQGTFTLTGSLATRLMSSSGSSSAYFFFRPDPAASNPPNYGNYAYSYLPSPLPGPSTPYTVGLTAGPWKLSDFYASASTNTDYVYVSVYDQSVPTLNATAGATLAADQTIDTTEGDIVFDVAEAAGQPTIGISDPYVYVSQSDPTGQKYVYLTSQSYAQNAATPVVRLIGPPGHYTFQAYAQILGSYITFATSSIDLGLGANTPAGTNEQVTLLDASGNPTGVQLTFADVTNAGATNGSTTTIGPAPPGSFTIMPAFNGNTYLSINTTATFSGNVEVALTYDPVALGLSPAQEQFLQLWHFHCDASGANCAWQYINDTTIHPNPNTAQHVIYGVTDSFSDFALLLPSAQHPPAVACVGSSTAPMMVNASAQACSAFVDNVAGVAGTCRDGGSGVSSCLFNGATSLSLGLGAQAIIVKGTGGDGSSAQCTSYINVLDKTAPALSVSASPSVLRPADDRLRLVQLSTHATDACDPHPTISCVVTSNSPTPHRHHDEDDDCDRDWWGRKIHRDRLDRDNDDVIWKDGQLYLRAETNVRSDRVYTAACTATDASGNAVTATTTVTVPLARW